jgi:hypothetical protein
MQGTGLFFMGIYDILIHKKVVGLDRGFSTLKLYLLPVDEEGSQQAVPESGQCEK